MIALSNLPANVTWDNCPQFTEHDESLVVVRQSLPVDRLTLTPYYIFSARQHMLSALYAIARPSVCLSICPSVRQRVDQSKTVELKIGQFSLYSSPIPLLFAV